MKNIDQLTPTQQIEQSLLRTYHESLFSPFCKAIRTYRLLAPGDHVAVCVSGGKDSMLMAKLFQMLQRHTAIPFETVTLIMDPGYSEQNRRRIEENADILGLDYVLYESSVFRVANAQTKNPCYLCARMRRGSLYAKARELGCNKIALGHHFDDVIETTLLAMFYAGQLQAMPPRLKAKNFPGMELIRPLYLIREQDILRWANHHQLRFLQCACRFTERQEAAGEDAHQGKRKEIKNLIRQLSKDNPSLEKNLFSSIHSVQLDTMVAWKQGGAVHSFLENLEDPESPDLLENPDNLCSQ